MCSVPCSLQLANMGTCACRCRRAVFPRCKCDRWTIGGRNPRTKPKPLGDAPFTRPPAAHHDAGRCRDAEVGSPAGEALPTPAGSIRQQAEAGNPKPYTLNPIQISGLRVHMQPGTAYHANDPSPPLRLGLVRSCRCRLSQTPEHQVCDELFRGHASFCSNGEPHCTRLPGVLTVALHRVVAVDGLPFSPFSLSLFGFTHSQII